MQGLVWVVAVGVLASRSLAGTDGKSQVETRLVLTTLGTVPFLVGGASLLLEAGGGLYWTFGGIVFAILGGVLNAWVFLVEIRR